MTYVFDVVGTLIRNIAGVDELRCMEIVKRLRDDGHRIILWTGEPTAIPRRLHMLADLVAEKPVMPDVDPASTTFIDDNRGILNMARRRGFQAVSAEDIASLISHRPATVADDLFRYFPR